MTMGEYAHFFCAYSPVIVHYLHFRVRAAEGVGPYMGCCLEANNPILLQPLPYPLSDSHTLSKSATIFLSGSAVQRETTTMKMQETTKAGSSS